MASISLSMNILRVVVPLIARNNERIKKRKLNQLKSPDISTTVIR